MKKSKLFGVALGVFVLLPVILFSNFSDWRFQADEDALEAIAVEDGGSIVVDSGQQFQWPGVPGIGSISPTAVESEDMTRQERPGPEFQVLSLRERVEQFDKLEMRYRARAARQIADDWITCRSYRPAEDGIEAEARRILERREANVSRVLAEAETEFPDEVDAAINELAKQSREDWLAEIMQDLSDQHRLCHDVNRSPYDWAGENRLLWLEKASDLGHFDARMQFVGSAFTDVRRGMAEMLVERKRKVLLYLGEGLARRDPRVLQALAHIAKDGVYVQPDDVAAWAYTKAALDIYEAGAIGTWRLPDLPGTRRFAPIEASFLQASLQRIEARLDASGRAEAELLARRILNLPEM